MATSRVIRAEILDGLPADNASALRARTDLRRINALMGNKRWVRRALHSAFRKRPGKMCFVEIGAGDGALCQRISHWFPGALVTGVDLVPRPASLPEAVSWRQGDLFTQLPNCVGEVLIGVMVLHHFSDERLLKLGQMLEDFQIVCFCETWRVRLPHLLGGLLWPFCGTVTRHDLHASIDAGFLPGELPRLLGLENWHVQESVDWRGSLRLLACKE